MLLQAGKSQLSLKSLRWSITGKIYQHLILDEVQLVWTRFCAFGYLRNRSLILHDIAYEANPEYMQVKVGDQYAIAYTIDTLWWAISHKINRHIERDVSTYLSIAFGGLPLGRARSLIKLEVEDAN